MLLLHWAVTTAAIAPVPKTGVIMNIINSGLRKTGVARNPWLPLRLYMFLCKLVLGRTAEMGTRTNLQGLAAGAESHGNYLSDCEVKGIGGGLGGFGG